ncbi:MAG TPA: APC family permease [Vicinamibacteria bacterium]
MSEPAASDLKRVLGRFDLVLLFVVAITNLNVVPVVAANGPFTLWLWLLALALFFWPQGVAVLELSRRHPEEGGVYVWTKAAFGDFHGFLSGWCYWTNNVFYVPTVLLYLVGVVVFVFGPAAAARADDRVFAFGLSTFLLWGLVWLNVRGLGVGKWVNNAGGIGTAVASLALIALAVSRLASQGSALSAGDLLPASLDFRLVSSFGVICFALVGLELASVMGGEIRDPARDLGPAVLWGGVISGLLYVGTSLAVLLAVPASEVGVIQGVLQAMERMAGEVGVAAVVAPIALVLSVSIAGIASAWLSGSARVPFVIGLDRFLPPALGRVHPRFGTPWVALVVHAALSTAFLGLSFLGASVREAYVTLLDLAVVLQLVPYLYLHAALLRYSAKDAPAPLRYAKSTLRLAGLAGLFSTALGMIVAFVPSRQIESVMLFELKMLLGCAVFVGLAVFFFRRGRAAQAA